MFPLEALAAASAAVHGGWSTSRSIFELRLPSVPGVGYFHLVGLAAAVDAIAQFSLPAHVTERLVAERILTPEASVAFGEMRLLVDVEAPPEGAVVFPGEPVLTIQGSFAHALVAAHLAASCLAQPTWVATQTARAVEAITLPSSLSQASPVVLVRVDSGQDSVAAMRAAYVAGAEGGTSFAAAEALEIPWISVLPPCASVGTPHFGEALLGWLSGSPEQIAFPLVSSANDGGLALTDERLRALCDAVRVHSDGNWNLPAVLLAVGVDDAVAVALRVEEAFAAAKLPRPRMLVGPLREAHALRTLSMEAALVVRDNFSGTRAKGAELTHLFDGFLFEISRHGERPFALEPSLVAIEEGGRWSPRSHASAAFGERPTFAEAGPKVTLRYWDEDGHPLCDVVHSTREKVQPARDVRFVSRSVFPESPHRVQRIRAFRSDLLLSSVVRAGKAIEPPPPLAAVRSRALLERNSLNAVYKRLESPSAYAVGVTPLLAGEADDPHGPRSE